MLHHGLIQFIPKRKVPEYISGTFLFAIVILGMGSSPQRRYNITVIEAIIFDVDGVLVDSRKANVAFFQALLAKAGHKDIGKEEILACSHLPLWQSLEQLTGSDDQHEIRRIFDMANDPGLRNRELLEFPEKLEDTLEELHKKYRLAIVTSRIKAGVEHIFTTIEIRHLFDVVITFEDYKSPKPHPEPLQVALRRLNMKANQTVYVGDSKTDVEAAKAAGMRCIFLSADSHKDAIARIEKLYELINVIKTLH
jgi:pyrophosphatase PpaX